MTLDNKLRALRDVIQYDIGDRGLARDTQHNLINACPDDFVSACRSIGANPNASVAIVTGFWIAAADPPCGETDGPLGALYLARACKSLGIPAVIVTDSFCKKALEVGCNSLGLDVDVLTIPPQSLTWPDYLSNNWKAIVERRKLTHLIAIERVGPARDGRCYSMRGRDLTPFMSPAHLLFGDAAGRSPRLETIGIGDGGNEIGMGKIPVEVIERNIPNGALIACRTPTDHLIVSGISNWGAYGLAAGIALVRGKPLDAALFDLQRERQLLELMVEQGPLVDGKTLQKTVSVDGIGFEEYGRALEKIRAIVGG